MYLTPSPHLHPHPTHIHSGWVSPGYIEGGGAGGEAEEEEEEEDEREDEGEGREEEGSGADKRDPPASLWLRRRHQHLILLLEGRTWPHSRASAVMAEAVLREWVEDQLGSWIDEAREAERCVLRGWVLCV